MNSVRRKVILVRSEFVSLAEWYNIIAATVGRLKETVVSQYGQLRVTSLSLWVIRVEFFFIT